MLTLEEIDAHLDKLTASEIATIAGLNPFESVHDVYRRKCRLATIDENLEHNRSIILGNIMEGPLIEYANKDRGLNIKRNRTMFVHIIDTLFAATPDGLDGDLVVEVKCVGPNMAPGWNKSPPDYVFCQVIWQLACTGKKKALVIANPWNAVQYYDIEYCQKLYDALKKKALKFWEYVQRREMPPLPNDNEISSLISRTYPDQKNNNIIIDNDNKTLHMHLQAYDDVKKIIKENEKTKVDLWKLITGKIDINKGVKCLDYQATFTQAKDSKVVNWKKIADELNADDKLIEKHTTIKTGARSLRVTKVK